MSTITHTDHPTDDQPAAPHADPRLQYLERRLTEAFDELWDNFVDPAEAVCDVDGTPWNRLAGGVVAGGQAAGIPFSDEQQLAQIRDQCRALATTNEFAINGHESRISYIVGSGHTYRGGPRPNGCRTAGGRGAGCSGRVYPHQLLPAANCSLHPPQ